MAKIKKILAVEEETFNKVEKLAKETGLNFQQYVYTLLAKAVNDSEKGENK